MKLPKNHNKLVCKGKNQLLKKLCLYGLLILSFFSTTELYSQTLQKIDSLANYYFEKHNLDSAFYYSEKALKMAKVEPGEEDLNYAGMLSRVFYIYVYKGDFEEAIHYVTREKEVRENIQGTEHEDYVTAISNLAEMYRRVGDYDNSLIMFQKAIEKTKIVLGTEHPSYGIRINNFAALYENMGHYHKALPLYLVALENTEKSLGKEHARYATRLNNIAGLYRRIGQYELALPLFYEALQITENTVGKQHSSYGISLSNLALLYENMGYYHKALPLFLEAIDITVNSLGKDHIEYGRRITNLALLYNRIGQFDRAIPLYYEALENCEKTLGKDHQDYGAFLNNLAIAYYNKGENDKAGPLFAKSLENTERALGKEHPLYGIRLNNLGSYYRAKEDYETALTLFEKALENTKNALGKEHKAYGNRLLNIGDLYMLMNDYEVAHKYYSDALEVTEKALGKQHQFYGRCLYNKADALFLLGRDEEALPLYRKAMQNNFHNINNVFSILAEAEKENYIHTFSREMSRYKSFFLLNYEKYPDIAADAYNIELVTKGMILQSAVQMRQVIQNSGDPVAMEKYDEWLILKNTLAGQYSLPEAQRFANLSEIEQSADLLEGELTRLSAGFNQAQMLTQGRWEDVKNNLKPGEAAIEFSSFNYWPGNTRTDSIMYVALIINPDKKYPILVPLFEEKELQSLIEIPADNHYRYINKLYGSISVSNTKLYELIWQPIENHLENTNSVYISPSGLLHKISFAAIINKNEEFLCDVYNINLVTGTSLITKEVPEEFTVQTASLFGGVNFNTPDTTDEIWKYLEGSYLEVQNLSKMLDEYVSSLNVFKDSEATETVFKKIAPKSELLHIATHGFFYPDPIEEEVRIRQSTIIGDVAFRGGSKGFGVLSFVENPRPLMRSGLVFAGANDVWRLENIPDGDDGVLTAQEVTAIDLSNTQLVVLSACETGLGDIRGSEGVYGLQRAFKMAGARYMIMSLWQVPDKETAEFMEVFYKKLLDCRNVRSAFNETQREMRQKYDPFFWAAFVLVE